MGQLHHCGNPWVLRVAVHVHTYFCVFSVLPQRMVAPAARPGQAQLGTAGLEQFSKHNADQLEGVQLSYNSLLYTHEAP